MKQKVTAMLPYLAVLAADFYLLPLLGKDTGTAMLLMLCVMPLLALFTAVLYGCAHGFCLLLPLAALVLFVPAIFLYYNSSAWVYAPFYAAVVLAGMGIGCLFYGKK